MTESALRFHDSIPFIIREFVALRNSKIVEQSRISVQSIVSLSLVIAKSVRVPAIFRDSFDVRRGNLSHLAAF